jgi:tRNA-(ms[2]io[6]A)-hydroxylase
MTASVPLEHIHQFLHCVTPKAWLDEAVKQIDVLLIDHAHCEKKAASTAISILYRYPEKMNLCLKLAQLAREELLHFEQVLGFIEKRGLIYSHLTPSRYAGSFTPLMRRSEPWYLIDRLLVGAIIEARSCERFAALAEVIPDTELSQYYRFLLKSESRHFEDYLDLAYTFAQDIPNFEALIKNQLNLLLSHEQEQIESMDTCFRFHSGIVSISSS